MTKGQCQGDRTIDTPGRYDFSRTQVINTRGQIERHDITRNPRVCLSRTIWSLVFSTVYLEKYNLPWGVYRSAPLALLYW